jgi:hypothetical protein|tara:strand:+ start:213 stop:494 length:282 start_codon:yes stop_codon:yes gene_type:complete
VLFHKKEAVLYVYSSNPIEENHQLVKDFKTKYIIKKIAFETLKNSYTIEENPVLFLDELWAENIEIKKKKQSLCYHKTQKLIWKPCFKKTKYT